MKIWTRFGVALAAPILLWTGTALAQAGSPPVHREQHARTVEGQVVRIDRTQGRVTIAPRTARCTSSRRRRRRSRT